MGRVVVIGDPTVGKTCLVTRIVKDEFGPTRPTSAVACQVYSTNDPNDPDIEFWDTAGMERYRSLNLAYFREASGGIIVFDLTMPRSFCNACNVWKADFLAHAPERSFIILVGNKCDLRDQIQVSEVDARLIANQENIHYFETSAVTGDGVPELISALLKVVVRRETQQDDLTEAQPRKCC